MKIFLIASLLAFLPELGHSAAAVYTGHVKASSATYVTVTVENQRITSSTINQGGLIQQFRTVTSSGVILPSDYLILCDTSAGLIEVQLPPVASTPVGRTLRLVITVTGFGCGFFADGAEQIGDRGSSFTTTGTETNLEIINTGSKWDFIILLDP